MFPLHFYEKFECIIRNFWLYIIFEVLIRHFGMILWNEANFIWNTPIQNLKLLGNRNNKLGRVNIIK